MTYVCFFCLAVPLWQDAFVSAENGSTPWPCTIPFTLSESNNIGIDATIAGEPATLMFHTGIGGVAVTQDAAKRMKQLKLVGRADVSSWGGEAASRFGTGQSLVIGPLTWAHVTVFETKHSGPGTDGKFGHTLFADKAIEIDFERRIMVIHRSLPELGSEYARLPLTRKGDTFSIECTLKFGERSYEHGFMVHTGFAGTALLSSAFVDANQLGERLKILSERELTDSLGNKLVAQSVCVPSFAMGRAELLSVPVEIFARGSVVGGELLRRFHLVIDEQRESIYLKPNSALDDPFPKPSG